MTTATVRRPARPAPKISRLERWKLRGPLLPALIFTLVLTQIPFALTIIFSFSRWNLLSVSKQAFYFGENFVNAFTDHVFWQSILNTVVMTAAATVLCIAIGLGLGMLLNHAFPGRGVARTLAITPFFMMPVAVTLFWKTAIFDPGFGFLGWISGTMGLPRISWLSDYPMVSLIMFLTWRFAPFALLILLAGLQGMPQDQLEASRVDGAGALRQFRFIMLPHMRPFIELTALLLAMNLLQTFGEIDILTAGGPAYATTNITYYIYLKGFQSFDFGAASAYGVVALILTIALILPALRLLSGLFKKEGRV
ncbi:MAG: sugar ABC transporter permease [Microbacteriaceae bacterium]|nr:MAG: sugar ABC transporter permease [Microbacteriaceae bacterium]